MNSQLSKLGHTQPPAVFIDLVDKTFECSVCLDVANDPSSCGNPDGCNAVFCYACLSACLGRTNAKKCPACTYILKRNAMPSRLLPFKNMISALQIYCPHKGESVNGDTTDGSRKRNAICISQCEWIGKLSNLDRHIESECECVPVTCQFPGCGAEMPQRDLVDHEATCLHKLFACIHCKTPVKHAMLDRHESDCDFAPVVCECHQSVPRSCLQDHKRNECALTVLFCPCAEYGCNKRVPRRDMEKHVADSAAVHLGLVMMALKSYKCSNNKMKNLVAALKETDNRVCEIQNELTATISELREVRSELEMGVDARAARFTWTVGNMKNKLKEAAQASGRMRYYSKHFYIHCQGEGLSKLHLCISLQGKKLGVFVHKASNADSSTESWVDLKGSQLTLHAPDHSLEQNRTYTFTNEDTLYDGTSSGVQDFASDVTEFLHEDENQLTITASILPSFKDVMYLYEGNELFEDEE